MDYPHCQGRTILTATKGPTRADLARLPGTLARTFANARMGLSVLRNRNPKLTDEIDAIEDGIIRGYRTAIGLIPKSVWTIADEVE